MGLGAARTGDNAQQVTLTFTSTTSDLENIDNQRVWMEVIHEVQTEETCIVPYVQGVEIKNATFKWQTIAAKRDPKARTAAVPDLDPRKNSFTKVGITLNPYDDDSYVVEYVEENADIHFERTVLETMERGFIRLEDRICFASMLGKVVKKTSSGWKTGATVTAKSDLDSARIGARSSAAGLIAPDYKTIKKILRRFYDENVSRSEKIYAAMTPNMEDILSDITQFQNKDYIQAMLADPAKKVVHWAGIYWVKCTPEVAPEAFYSDKYVKKVVKSLDVLTSTSTDYDLTTTNHEAIPFWIKSNIRYGRNRKLDKYALIMLPSKRMTPAIIRTLWAGGARLQDKKQYVLVVPKT